MTSINHAVVLKRVSVNCGLIRHTITQIDLVQYLRVSTIRQMFDDSISVRGFPHKLSLPRSIPTQ